MSPQVHGLRLRAVQNEEYRSRNASLSEIVYLSADHARSTFGTRRQHAIILNCQNHSTELAGSEHCRGYCRPEQLKRTVTASAERSAAYWPTLQTNSSFVQLSDT